MAPETRIALLKEMERIKRTQSRNNYSTAWICLCLSVFWIAWIIYLIITGTDRYMPLLNSFAFLIAMFLLLQSFYIIIRHVTDRKFILLFGALLESKNTAAEESEKYL